MAGEKCVFLLADRKKVLLPKYGRFLLHITINHAAKKRFAFLTKHGVEKKAEREKSDTGFRTLQWLWQFHLRLPFH